MRRHLHNIFYALTRTLNEYLIEVSKKSKILLESTSAFIDMNQCDAWDHPLDNVLEWDN